MQNQNLVFVILGLEHYKLGLFNRCARFRMGTVMAELEDSVPWEVRLLQSYCHSESDLDEVSTSAYDWLEKY